LRTSNKYHKFFGEFQLPVDAYSFEALKHPFKFMYVNDEIRTEVKNLFPAYEFAGGSGTLITQDNKVTLMLDDTGKAKQCKVTIDGGESIVSAITPQEVHLLGGQRFKNRKKTYLIELEV
jgi:hypothetical protein